MKKVIATAVLLIVIGISAWWYLATADNEILNATGVSPSAVPADTTAAEGAMELGG